MPTVLQGITTKYVGPTNTLPSRVIARSAHYRRTINYDTEFSIEDNHLHAARMLSNDLGWQTHRIVQGSDPRGTGYLFVFDVP